jgi:hypothetical protein
MKQGMSSMLFCIRFFEDPIQKEDQVIEKSNQKEGITKNSIRIILAVVVALRI